VRLSTFILANMPQLLQEWEAYARSLGVLVDSQPMDVKTLRNDAESILRAVAVDIEGAQSPEQQEAKGKGARPADEAEPMAVPARRHGAARAQDGFTIDQMISEFRALRASVLRLWGRAHFPYTIHTQAEYDQVTRFNEALDEALAGSLKDFHRGQELMSAARAKARLATLGTLAAGLGHDVNNMLIPMEVSLDEIEHVVPPQQAEPALKSLRGTVMQLRGLVKGLRGMAVDDPAATPGQTRLDEWWEAAAAPYTWALPRGVRLRTEGLQDPSLAPVAVPGHALMQAVFNLVQNAAEAMKARGGSIWVEAKPGPNNTVELRVRDDGPGMDSDTLARCTEAFFTTKPKEEASGLGLALVRTAVERHGGALTIESTPGKGCACTLALPVARAATAPAAR
jgi:signal transduction histidine kinase